MVLPYVKQIVEPFSKTSDKYDIESVYKLNNKSSSIMNKGKDNIDIMNQQNVVYKIDCNDFDKSYISETKRALKNGVKDYRDNINLTNQDKHNVLTLSRIQEQHEIDWEGVQILDNENKYRKRCLYEMLYIKSTKKSVKCTKRFCNAKQNV